VAGTMLVYDQLTLMRNIDLGFKKDATLILNFNWNGEVQNHLDAIKNEIKSIKGITSVATSHTTPGESTTNLFSMIEMKDGKLSATNINTNFVDHDFLPAYGIDIVSGRNFSRSVAADDTAAFILNETAVRDFGMTPEEAIGKKVDQNGKKGTIIGVMKDYHYRSLHYKIEPLMVNINKYPMRKFSIHISDSDIPAVMEKLEAKWKAITPSLPFTFSFLDDDYDRLYSADAKLGKVAAIFSGLAIFVGCLGLLGLTSFSVERRVKEIGIRKVLGASSSHVVYIISSEFVKLILVAFVIAVPLTYFMIMEWLSKFTHQISVGPITFIIAGISVLVLAWTAVSYLSFKAAGTNPTAALRDE
jgi:putative ABC transport system permease protein